MEHIHEQVCWNFSCFLHEPDGVLCADFQPAACRFEPGRRDKRLPAHSPSKMNTDNLIRLNLRSPNPHAPWAAPEVSVFATSPNPRFCAPAVSSLVDAVKCVSFSLRSFVKEGGPHRGMEFQLLARHLWSGQRLSVCLGYRSDTWACSLEPYTRSDGTFTGVKFGPRRPRGLTVKDGVYNLMTGVLESVRDD